jgi:acetolactate synthase-1/3 small subunit
MKKRSFLENAIFKIDSALLFDEKQIQNIIKSNSEIVTVSRDFCDFKVWKRSDINDI